MQAKYTELTEIRIVFLLPFWSWCASCAVCRKGRRTRYLTLRNKQYVTNTELQFASIIAERGNEGGLGE